MYPAGVTCLHCGGSLFGSQGRTRTWAARWTTHGPASPLPFPSSRGSHILVKLCDDGDGPEKVLEAEPLVRRPPREKRERCAEAGVLRRGARWGNTEKGARADLLLRGRAWLWRGCGFSHWFQGGASPGGGREKAEFERLDGAIPVWGVRCEGATGPSGVGDVQSQWPWRRGV